MSNLSSIEMVVVWECEGFDQGSKIIFVNFEFLLRRGAMRKISPVWALGLGVVAAIALLQAKQGLETIASKQRILVGDGAVVQEAKPEHGVDAKSAVTDLDSYFDSIPTASVNAFHEPELQGNPEFGGLEEQSSKHLASSVATADLLNYYSKVPTHNVNAFHEPAVESSEEDGGSPEHVRVKYSAVKARSDLSSYFLGIPTHIVNAYHEPSQTVGRKQQGLKEAPKESNIRTFTVRRRSPRHGLNAEDAQEEMSSYFMQIPTKNVAADHTLRHSPSSKSISSPQVAKTVEAAVQVKIMPHLNKLSYTTFLR